MTDPYPKKLDAVDMVEFTKGRSYATGYDRHDRPYVVISTGIRDTITYTWAIYEQMYVRD